MLKREKHKIHSRKNTLKSASCKVLTAALLKIQIFWDVTLCGWASDSDVSETQ
jgi:hypothetical protein